MTETYDIDTDRFPSFSDYLKAEGKYERIRLKVDKMIIARQLVEAMKDQGISKSEMALRMGTSRAQLDRVLDPVSQNVTIETLARAAEALGEHFHMELVKKAA
jgi:antitoxin HicB